MSMVEEKSTDSVQSVEIPSDMFNLLQNGQSVSYPPGGDVDLDNTDFMQLTVMKGLQEQDTKPHLKILEQPRQRGFRFRYGCEGPSHGGLPGVNSQRGKRSFPAVEICNYKGPARIVVSLVTNEETPRPHAHSLVGKHCKDGLCTVQVGPKDMTASFPNLGILHVTRKDVVPTLKTRILAQHRLYKDLINDTHVRESGWVEPSDQEIEKKAKEMAKDMDLSVVRLCFQTYLPDVKGHFTQPLDPVISVPVFDSKAPNATTLKICRMDKSAGCCTGGEEVYLLCDKVQKEDIQVKFFELSTDGQITWQSLAEFGPTDVHRQYAIVFKTPPYRDINIDRPVYVHVQLKRKSDSETSDPKPFTFHPQVPDREGILRKRKKHLAHFNEYSSSYSQGGVGGSTGMGGGGGSNTFQFNNPNMGYGGNNFNFNTQMATSASQSQQVNTAVPQPALAQQSTVVAPSNSSQTQQVLYTTSTTTVNRQPLPSIATLTQRNQAQQPQYTLQQQQQQQLQQQQQQQQLQQQQQQQLQPQQQTMAMNFQVPTGMTFQNPAGGGGGAMAGNQIKMETDNNNSQNCITGELHLDSNTMRDCATDITLMSPSSDLVPKGIMVQRSKDTEEKTIQTDDIPIDIDSMAWQVAQVTANALHDYAATGDIKTVLTVQRHLIAVEDDSGDTPLHAAVIHKKYDVLHALLSAVIKIPQQTIVNQVNHLKQTPLHLAVITKQPKMVEVLMRCGADPNLCDLQGNTPLHLAIKYGMAEGVTFLVRGPKAKAALRPTLARVNLTNFAGLAPVHLAVIGKNLDMLKTLVSSGADVNLADGKMGRSPLHYAVEVEHFPILGYLLIEAKADVQAVTFSGDTALHLASSLDLRAVAALLLATGANPKQENYDVESDGEKDEEEDIDDDDNDGDGEEGITEIEEGDDKKDGEEKEKRGRTPYQLARSAKMKEILTGRSAIISKSIKEIEFDEIETASTVSSIGSLCEEPTKTVSWDEGYFSVKKSSSRNSALKDPWSFGGRTLGSSLVTAQGDMDRLSDDTIKKLASLLDENYPISHSWYTLANRLGLSNMLNFLKQVPSQTLVIFKQFQAMDGTIEELRAVLSSMKHQKALEVLNQDLSGREISADEYLCLSATQSLKEMSITSDQSLYLQQAVY